MAGIAGTGKGEGCGFGERWLGLGILLRSGRAGILEFKRLVKDSGGKVPLGVMDWNKVDGGGESESGSG